MANNQVTTQINVQTNAVEANKQLTTTEQLLTTIAGQLDDMNKAVVEGANKQTKAVDASTKATKGLANGFKGVGLAIKAMGVGLILQAFQVLKDLFQSSQPIVDAFGIAFKSLNIAFNDFVKFIGDNAGKVKGYFKGMFDDPIGSLKSFGNAIKENLIERFNSYLDTLGYIAKGVKELFAGNFDAAIKQFGKAGKESIDVFTGVNNTVDKTVEGVKNLSKAVSDYTKDVIAQATAMQKVENAAKIAEAQNEKLIKQYEIAAEKQRQLRDDTNAAITDRIAANEKLGKILDQQAKAMTANAQLVLKSAQQNYSLNKTIENQVALIKAQTAAQDVQATVTGFQSEQLVNKVALEKELIDLNQTSIDGIAERGKIERDFAAEQKKDDTDRLAAQKAALESDLINEIARLTAKRDIYQQGTQAWEDANQELLSKQQEINNALITNDKQTNDTIVAENNARLQRISSDDALSFQTRLEALNEQLVLINQTEFSSEEARTAALKANSDARLAIEKEEVMQRLELYSTIGDGLQQLSGELTEGTALQKVLAVAGASISTYAAISKTLEAFAGVPVPGYAIAQAVATGVFGLLQVKKILAVKVPGGGGAGSAGSVGSASAPSFNTVGAGSQNQLAETIAAQQGQVPVAQVVSSQVTTQQALDRQVINNATFI